MIYGVDTSFLVSVEVMESAMHLATRTWMQNTFASDSGARLALCPQVLAEFVHVVTDPKRFQAPLPTNVALHRAEQWWQAKEVLQLHPNDLSTKIFFQWMQLFQLGRKRILDTMLAATYCAHQVTNIVSSNARDFKVFQKFTLVSFE